MILGAARADASGPCSVTVCPHTKTLQVTLAVVSVVFLRDGLDRVSVFQSDVRSGTSGKLATGNLVALASLSGVVPAASFATIRAAPGLCMTVVYTSKSEAMDSSAKAAIAGGVALARDVARGVLKFGVSNPVRRQNALRVVAAQS